LLELALNLRYITNGRNPEARAKRFVHFVAKIKMEWGKKAIEYFAFPPSSVRILLASFRGIGQSYPDELSKPVVALMESFVKKEKPA
jgi:hypothetical protein